MQVSIITPDFTKSKWTDQEVGFALGRNVPIVPVRLEADPYGFIGRVQAITGSLKKPEEIAVAVFDATMRLDPLKAQVIDALVGAVAEADSFADAIAGMRKVSTFKAALSNSHVERLLRAARDNSQIKGAFGVADQIQKMAKNAGVTLPQQTAQSFNDDIPF